MGLDIYLYKYENYSDTIERERLGTEFSNKIWEDEGEYDKVSDERKVEIRTKTKEYYNSLNLDDYGSDETKKNINIKII